MGTRGTMAVRVDGVTKSCYNHWDSYYSGLGEDILKIAKTLTGPNKEAVKDMARNLQPVPEGSEPTPEQIIALAEWTDLGVSSRSTSDWYCLLRGTQGQLLETLKAGYYEPFPLCEEEYSYLIDFDADEFVVWAGDRKTATFKLDALPTSLRVIDNVSDDESYYG